MDTGEVEIVPDRGQHSMRRRKRPRAVAISGANSFIGQKLVRLLELDESISAIVLLDIAPPPNLGKKTRYYSTDLSLASVESKIAEILHAERIDAFVHLAFLTSPISAVGWASEFEINGTRSVLRACSEHRIGRFVLASSTMIYGAHPTNPSFLKEDHTRYSWMGARFIQDKIDIENQVQHFAEAHASTTVTILRLAPILGPTIDNFITNWLSRSIVLTVMGFDPMIQFLHEVDAVSAVKLAVDRDISGIYNIVSKGVLPLSKVIKLTGRIAIPIPFTIFKKLSAFCWRVQLSKVPPQFVDFLRYLCVADGKCANDVLGFVPTYTCVDAVLDFQARLRLREAKLLSEAT